MELKRDMSQQFVQDELGNEIPYEDYIAQQKAIDTDAF